MRFDRFRLARPLLHAIDPERAHELTVMALRAGLAGRSAAPSDPVLATRVLGLDFANPLGLAAGFDKNAAVADAMLGLGFGFVEVGTVTLRPQRGNPKPRLFRLPADGAVINRMGFNNDGLDAVRARLESRRANGRARGRRGIVGANVGPNKDAADPVADCARCVESLAPVADYLVVNVSSPNTLGLRALQAKDALLPLLGACLAARGSGGRPPPLLVKIAPDLSGEELQGVATAAMSAGIDGLIATNTTLARPPSLRDVHRSEAGGLSGRPLLAPSTAILAQLFRLTEGAVPLIGVGGIASGADAYAKIRAGASLLQLYTALVYGGPGLVLRILTELAALLRADGFTCIGDAVGSGVGDRGDTSAPHRG
ncbi:MAG: quinone-dependent dihydroorotate dehydrogenase [Rhodospirillales bacterium]|nr:quinone-dependent dihydroorotate dehydrogenase [Rhodospirillales bacterium]